MYELLRHVEREDEPVRWRRGRSLPYGEAGSFWALAEIVKAQLGVLETDDAAAVEDVVHAGVRDLLGNDRRVERHLAGLLGVDVEAHQVDRDDAFAAWRRFFEAVAEQEPLVLVFDDLQWADDGLLDFVDYLVDWGSQVPMLVVATARPELLERRPSWGGGKLNASTLALSPLDEVESARLVASLLEQPLVDAQTQSTLMERVGGNPLYAEQYALLCRERDTWAELPLPEGVQGIIAARLDLLPEEEKRVLQDAAVLGKVFWPGALRGDGTAVARTLHALERKDFVRRERVSSVDGEDEYVFRHLLVRDVAYAQIPRAARAERHRATAAWIESLGSERNDHAVLVADHYTRALELARALRDFRPDDEEHARSALRRAGDHALRLGAFARAATLYEQAVGLSPTEDERPALLLAYGKALQRLVDARGDDVLAEASRLFHARRDAVGAGEAEAARAELLWFRGNGVDAIDHARRAVELLRESPASIPKAYAMSTLARIETFTGGIESGVAIAHEAVAIANTLGEDEVLAHALNSLGTAKAQLGDRSGLADLERSLELALAVRSPEVCRAYNNLAGTLLNQLGEAAKARQLYDEGQRTAQQLGIPHWIDFFELAKAVFLLGDGEWDALLALVAEGRVFAEDPAVAFVYLARGEVDDACRLSASAIAMARPS
ncbi:MAG TPA: AAA family ATPase, partial [Gaiellaceae bacterium]|nr:AAA family ATPase [Gaiellaceae bacterium]